MKNDKVYEGIVKFFDAEGTFLSQSTISVQKVCFEADPVEALQPVCAPFTEAEGSLFLSDTGRSSDGLRSVRAY